MDSWREIILAKLDQYAGFDLDVQDTQIAVTCQNPDSFSVSFFVVGGYYQVAFDGWHEDFDDVEDALNCFCIRPVRRVPSEGCAAWDDGM